MTQLARTSTAAIERQHHMDEPSSVCRAAPKNGLRPKVSSYSIPHGNDDRQGKLQASSSDIHQGQGPGADMDLVSLSRPNGLVETVMCKLISSPYEGLDVHMNGPLLQICEAYRNLCDREAQLQRQLEAQLESHHSTVMKMQQIQNRWTEERQDYRTEVKRLELLLAKGKRGLAEVTLARKDSLLWQRKRKDHPKDNKAAADDGLQTIFEVLERARHGQDQAYNSQRATFRHRATSPSAHMKSVSQQLVSKKSMTNVHADLPFGSPPDLSISTLAEATLLEARDNLCKAAGRDAKSSEMCESDLDACLSDDTFSTFSAISEPGSEGNVLKALKDSVVEDADDHAALRRVADMLVHRRDADLASMIQKLVQLVNESRDDNEDVLFATERLDSLVSMGSLIPQLTNKDAPASVTERSSAEKHATSSRSSSNPSARDISRPGRSIENVRRHPSMMAKASGFLQRLRPLLHGEISAAHQRRFSFEAGDDTMTLSALSYGSVATPDLKGLRRSISLLSTKSYGTMLPYNTTPAKQTPVSSGDSPIPGSVATYYRSSLSTMGLGTVRKDSHSSLLTAINNNHDRLCTSGSRSKSVAQPPCVQQEGSAASTSHADQSSFGDN
nr:hypothetical protein CFP56_42145 [Quercus suber]